MQSPIHEGYEYQDYFAVSTILQLMLHKTEAVIDRKDFSGDKFDDLKVKTPNGNTEFQIQDITVEGSKKDRRMCIWIWESKCMVRVRMIKGIP